jgi:hypothetical protein
MFLQNKGPQVFATGTQSDDLDWFAEARSQSPDNLPLLPCAG